MPTSISSQAPILARSTATILGSLGLIMGTWAISQPSAFSTAHGVVHDPWKSSRNPYIPMLGSYIVANSAGMLALVYLKEDRALALQMLQSLLTGAVDGWWTLLALRPDRQEKTVTSEQPSSPQIANSRTAAFIHWGISGFVAAVGAWSLSVAK